MVPFRYILKKGNLLHVLKRNPKGASAFYEISHGNPSGSHRGQAKTQTRIYAFFLRVFSFVLRGEASCGFFFS